MSKNNLIGQYKLRSHGIYDSEGCFTPTSIYINGELIYGSASELSVLILFSEDPQNNKEFLAYVGQYRCIDEKTLSHDISLCNNQKRNNTSELREFNLKDNQLILKAALSNGSYFEAVWVKN